MFYKVLLHTNICVRYVTETVLNYQTFDPLFDANILNHINDMISSLIL